jgi:magnesium chelatase subunit I
VYEGEQEGAAGVAQNLIGEAVVSLFPTLFPKISKLERPNTTSPYQAVLDYFLVNSDLELLDDLPEKEYRTQLDAIEPLAELVKKYQPSLSEQDHYFVMEFVLWALVEQKKLSKDRFTEGYQFRDLLGSYLSGLQ